MAETHNTARPARPTSLERAFELARTGEYPTSGDVKVQLNAEGFAGEQIFGPSLLRQLRRLISAAKEEETLSVGDSRASPDQGTST